MLTLYYTAGCHLCEEAEALVMAFLATRGISANALTRTEIAEEDVLLERYGLLIPVLRLEASGQEINWPFGLNDIIQALQG